MKTPGRGSITTSKRTAPERRCETARTDRRLWRPHRIQQLAAGNEHDPGARQREQPAAEARIGLQVMLAAFDRAERDRIDDEPRFPTRLDRKQPTGFPKHWHSRIVKAATPKRLI
jgi:hypothetical protein